jgi:hypothetical protein
MGALRGEDERVKPEIAFVSLRKVIVSFDNNRKSEMRVLRELIILDKYAVGYVRLVEEGIYCEEISTTTLFGLESNRPGS